MHLQDQDSELAAPMGGTREPSPRENDDFKAKPRNTRNDEEPKSDATLRSPKAYSRLPTSSKSRRNANSCILNDEKSGRALRVEGLYQRAEPRVVQAKHAGTQTLHEGKTAKFATVTDADSDMEVEEIEDIGADGIVAEGYERVYKAEEVLGVPVNVVIAVGGDDADADAEFELDDEEGVDAGEMEGFKEVKGGEMGRRLTTQSGPVRGREEQGGKRKAMDSLAELENVEEMAQQPAKKKVRT